MNLAFACSLRLGEIIGLQWDNVHISDADIAADDAHVIIMQELSRVSKDARMQDSLWMKKILFRSFLL